VLNVVVARLRSASATRAESTGTTAAQRLNLLLDRLARQHGNPHPDGIAITLPFSQEELAAAIDASREAVVRALRSLRTEGIINTTTRQQILILAPETLHHRAHHPDT
jgi:CRP/FNR family transcriptional regulator, cyclic AMP receptor protein